MELSENKQLVLSIYNDVIELITIKFSSIVGGLTVRTLMKKAQYETGEKYKFILSVKIEDEIVNFNDLETYLKTSEIPTIELKNGFREFLNVIFDFLTRLTGNVLLKENNTEIDSLLKELDKIDR